jgi:hypothetical protein
MSEEDEKRLDAHIESLGEFYENVQIFCSKVSDNNDRGTAFISRGAGNMFARIGHVRDWLIRHDELTRINTREEDNE